MTAATLETSAEIFVLMMMKYFVRLSAESPMVLIRFHPFRKRKMIPIPVKLVFYPEGWMMKISCIEKAILMESIRMM